MSSGSPGTSNPNPNQSWSQGAFLPRWAWWLVLPGLLMPVGIVAFMAIAQFAHDESRCPFKERSVQELGGGVSVREEARQCLPGTEERRYRLQRGEKLQVLGERRLASEAFAAARYHWTATVAANGEVQIVVHNDAHGDVLFREGTAAEHAGGPLLPPKRQ